MFITYSPEDADLFKGNDSSSCEISNSSCSIFNVTSSVLNVKTIMRKVFKFNHNFVGDSFWF